MAKRELPSPEVLRQLLDYNPETGVLTWKARGPEWFRDSEHQTAGFVAKRWNARYAGRRAFTAKCKGYHVGNIGKEFQLRAARVIWAMCYGVWPEHEIDHKNTDTSDDRLHNLRHATSSQNKMNRPSPRQASGMRGVFRYDDKWVARIKAHGVTHELGTFGSPAAAADAYKDAARRLHGEFKYAG